MNERIVEHLYDEIRSYGRLLRRSLFVVLLFNCSVTSPSYAEHATLDSLTNRLHENLHDTDRAKTLNMLAWELKYTNTDTAIILSSEALSIAEAYELHVEIANSFNKLGSFNYLKSDYSKALGYFLKALNMYEELDRKFGIAANLIGVGIAYKEQGNYPQALEYYFKALKMNEELGNKIQLAVNLGNIGVIYDEQGDYPKALEYYFKALKINEEMNRKHGIAISLSNIGVVYEDQDNYPKALEYYFKALKMNEELGNKNYMSVNLGNIGVVYMDQGDYSKALEYYFKSLKMAEELEIKDGIAIILDNIGSLYTKIGEFEKAEEALQKALNLSKEIGSKEYLKDQYINLSNLYDTIGRPAQAFEAYKLYIIYRDSMDNEENTKAQTRTEMKYEYEKAELVKEQEENEKHRILNEKLKRRDNLQYSVVLICLLVVGVLVAMLGKLSLPVRMAEGIIFFSFLILFEFLLVLADPYIDAWSGGAPGFKLLFNAGIAALIFPLHAFFESKLKGTIGKSGMSY